MEKNNHNVSMASRRVVDITGVTDIGAYNDEEIEITTTDGIMTIYGSDLNIIKLDVDSGVCSLNGRVNSIIYQDEGDVGKVGILKRVFKC